MSEEKKRNYINVVLTHTYTQCNATQRFLAANENISRSIRDAARDTRLEREEHRTCARGEGADEEDNEKQKKATK